jgi:hypothetical protein
MRQFLLLLCLLVVAALGWIVRSAELPTTAQHSEAVVPKANLASRCLNTGFKDVSTTVIRTRGAARIVGGRFSAEMEAHPHSMATLPSGPNQSARFEFIAIDAGWLSETLPATTDWALVGLD